MNERGLVADQPEQWPIVATEVVHDTGRVIAIRQDSVSPPAGGSSFVRDIVVHPGAVGVIAINDADEVLLVSQYRHPVGHRLLEPPAGLLDIEGEEYVVGAARELAEEGHVRAENWQVLADVFTSPGMTTEALRIFLARGITDIPLADRYQGEDEEADMSVVWVPLKDLVDGVLAGRLHNPVLCVGALAAWVARSGGGYDELRPGDAPWPARAHLLS